jgi:MoxR-like ATPase
MNPIEQEGTYPLPEAQLDRFMCKVRVDYPSRDEELAVLRLKKTPAPELERVFTAADLAEARELAGMVHTEEKLEEYVVDLVRATREPAAYGIELGNAIRWGAGPRAVVFFLQACRARAVMAGRDYVIPADVRQLAPLILRHRILLSYEALAEGLTPDAAIASLVGGLAEP